MDLGRLVSDSGGLGSLGGLGRLVVDSDGLKVLGGSGS